MPEISRFFGVIVFIFYDDHPPPHFHVRHGDDKARIIISDSTLLSGTLPQDALKLVRQWTDIHRQELVTAWEQASAGLRPNKIAPLK